MRDAKVGITLRAADHLPEELEDDVQARLRTDEVRLLE